VNIETVAIGDCIVDLVEQDGKMLWYAGGAALNVAVGLSRLGNLSSLVAQIGLDESGMRLSRYLREEQVHILPCFNVDYTGVATSMRVNGEPVYHFNAPMQRRRIMPNDLIGNALLQARAVAFSSFAYDVPEQIAAFRDILRKREGAVFIDPNPRPSLVRDMAAFRHGFELLAAFADFVKLSDEDIKIFYGSGADYASVTAHLAALGVKKCLITQGARGASLYAHGQEVVHVGIWQDPRPIIDTMGAGDATFAAFINFILRHGEPEGVAAWGACLNAAMESAAATCRAFGGSLQIYNGQM